MSLTDGERAQQGARSRLRVLVTGAGGFLGSHLAFRLAPGALVLGVSRRPFGPGALGADLDDGETLAAISKFAPDTVFHLAALTDADLCEREPDRARRANVEATERLARAVASSARRFVYASTDLVFDGSRGGYDEGAPAIPLSVYGATKLEGERAARAVLGRRVTAVRLALLYGPRRNPASRASFAERMIRSAASGSEVSLFTDEFRSPLYVEDAAEALARLPELGECPEVLNLGGPERCSRYELGRIGLEAFGIPRARARPVSAAEAGSKAPRPKDVSLDSKLASRLGLSARSPKEGFRAMMREMGLEGFVVGS